MLSFRIIGSADAGAPQAADGLDTLAVADGIVVQGSPPATVVRDGERQLVLLGWVIGRHGEAGLTSVPDPEELLRKAPSSHALQDWARGLEGRFVLVSLEATGTCQVCADRFGKADVYIQESGSRVVLASDLGLVDTPRAARGFDQVGLAHALSYYGYRPPKRRTIYNGVRRLGVGDVALIEDGKLSVRRTPFVPVASADYGDSQLDNYVDAFLAHLEAAGSHSGNVVYLSSGWDSTSILAGLVHIFGANNVRGVIGRMLYSERSGNCNRFEIERASKFADHFGIKLDVVDLDYAKKGPEQFDLARAELKRHGLNSFTGVNHWLFADCARRTGNGDEAIFAGEISDGAHNLGFSQYTTIFHPSFEFREYADKMASYLFGPTFVKRLLAGDHADDPIFALFRLRAGEAMFDEPAASREERMRQMFVSFFLRNGRRPLWSGSNVRLLTAAGLKRYTDELSREYFPDAGSADPDELYSWYLHLYNSFHWQGATVATLQSTADSMGLRAHLPFWDGGIQDFLSAMPEAWGRGLDFRQTKYPLKWMLSHRLEYPLELQQGPHAYAYDVDPSFNHNFELMHHSSLTGPAKSLLGKRPYHEVLSEEMFDIGYVDRLVDTYLKDEPQHGLDLEVLVSVYLMCQVGWDP